MCLFQDYNHNSSTKIGYEYTKDIKKCCTVEKC